MSSFVPRSLLLLSALVPLSACGGAPDVPSILLITLDTTRQDALSCYGAIPGLTPSVDRIAAEGITYLQAHTVAPITLPSHTSMLTGLWPPRHGLRINGAASLPAEAETLAELASGLGLETAAFLSAAVLGSTFALDQGFDVYDEVDTHKEKASNSFPRRNGRATIDAALSWLEARNPSRPFFCWVHLFDAHGPWPDVSPYLPLARGSLYLAQVAKMDREVGRLITGLEEQGGLDKTLIMVVGDHGESLGDRGESAHGVNCYEPTMCIPFLVRHPDGRRAGERSDENVSVVDVFSTVCEALDLTAQGVDGQSLLSGRVPAERGVYFESLYGYANFGWSPLVGWLQDGQKYMHTPQPELYDLGSDAGELDNTIERVDADRWVEAIRNVESLPRLEAAAPTAMTEELVEQLSALGYALAGPVKEIEDPLGPSDRMSPHATRDEYVKIQEAFLMFGDSPKALAAWTAVLESNPRNRTARGERAYHLVQLKRWAEAATEYREIAKAGDLRSMHWIALGVCIEKLGDPESAIVHFRKGIEVDPNNPVARREYVRAMEEAGRADEAQRELAALDAR